ncbi:MAG: B12-binding domain-containing radical SAM protein [Lentisphaerae bacterium]|nr:B12-binding domain-containing radical SAM protein [Lentisphaerota bacterium]
MRIALVNPPRTFQVWAGVPDIFNGPDAYLFPPLGIMALSSWLKRSGRHEPHLVDCVARRWSAGDAAGHIARLRPDVLGVTANTHNLVNVLDVIRAVRLRVPGIFVVIGGSHVTAFPGEAALFPGIDAAISGDGEAPLLSLLDCLEQGRDWSAIPGLCRVKDGMPCVNPAAAPERDLDAFPFPDREGLAPGDYYTPGMKMARATTIISSRGCPFQCSFCSVPHQYRTRTAKNIVDELELCAGRYGIQEFHFVDDLFNPTPERVMEISMRIIERKLNIAWGFKAACFAVSEPMLDIARRAGCVRIHYGVETWSDAGLEALNKKTRVRHIRDAFEKTRKAGIRAIAYMIAGCPHEKTPADVMAAAPFVKSLKPDYVVFSLYTPYPDAPIFKEGAARGLWSEDCWRSFMLNPTREHRLPTTWSEHMSKDRLVGLLRRLHNAFYFSPAVLFRTLLSLRTLPELVRIVRGGIILLKLQFLRADSGRI